MTNMDKLYASVAANGPVCVGLAIASCARTTRMFWTSL